MNESFSLETVLDHAPPEDIIARFRRNLEDRGVEMRENGDGYQASLPSGTIELVSEGETTRLRLSSDDRGGLFTLKESIEARMRAEIGNDAFVSEWTGDILSQAHPPNFCKATVLSKTDVGSAFMRITVTGENIERFFRNAMHFRLLMPRLPGGDPRWPTLDGDGRTVWPDGPHELRKPVYTVRQFDEANGTLDFDIFRHESGATLAWAEDAAPGDTVGLLGPSGGWIPEASWMLLAGDETAMPAVMRILDNVPPETAGYVLLSIGDEETKCDLDVPHGMQLLWIIRDDDDHRVLLDTALDIAMPSSGDVMVWFAANRSEALRAREIFRDERGFSKQNSYIASYWG